MREVIRGSRAENALPRQSISQDVPILPSGVTHSRPSMTLDTAQTHESQKSLNTRLSPNLSPAALSPALSPTRSPALSPTLSPTRHAATSPSPGRHVAFRADSNEPPSSPPADLDRGRRRSSSFFHNNTEDRPEEDVYLDSRAATKREWKRRATTLDDYYKDNPELLPQLPFTWHRGKRRWRLIGLIILMWIDACVIPIALYYAMHYGGQIEGWIIFAIVTTIWGGPTYVEFGVRTLKLMKKERFYRPLGTNYRWCFDYLNYVSSITIAVVTALFIIGGAPHIVWLRVLCMPMPALLYCLGILVGYPTLYHKMGWPARHRFSSTPKGGKVRPGVYYIVEDMVAVNANAGRPYREAVSARYEASPRFRQMMYQQSVFWSIPAIVVAIPLTIIAVIHPVPATIAYGICWAVPFIWATIWAFISMNQCKRAMVLERNEWELTNGPIEIKETALETSNSNIPPIPEEEKPEEERERTPGQIV